MSRFRKEYRIGAGGMGEVFRVTRVLHDGEEGPVACKVMRGKLAMDGKCVRLFHREAKLGLAVGNDSPNVVSVYEYLAQTAPSGGADVLSDHGACRRCGSGRTGAGP